MMHSRRLLLLALPFLFLCVSINASAQSGVAYNFGIDGNMLSNSPAGTFSDTNDWLDGPAGFGTGALFQNGTPKNSTTTFHLTEITNGSDPSVFSGSEQLHGDPNNYVWLPGSVVPYTDMENALVHSYIDNSGDLWLSVAVDRYDANGDSYINIEFLQNPLYKNPDSTFTSLGPDGGRTENDLLLILTLNRFGMQATVDTYRWTCDGGSSYSHSAFTPPPGTIFAAANIDSQVVVPYGALGSTVYSVNSFGETAMNISELLVGFDGCPITATIFIHTKSSATLTAYLRDLFDPIQMTFCIGTSVLDDTPSLALALHQVHPNPFAHSTMIEFDLENAGAIALEVFDIAGKRVAVLNNRWNDAGPHAEIWNGRDDAGHSVASGLYFCRLTTAQGSLTQKMVLIR